MLKSTITHKIHALKLEFLTRFFYCASCTCLSVLCCSNYFSFVIYFYVFKVNTTPSFIFSSAALDNFFLLIACFLNLIMSFRIMCEVCKKFLQVLVRTMVTLMN